MRDMYPAISNPKSPSKAAQGEFGGGKMFLSLYIDFRSTPSRGRSVAAERLVPLVWIWMVGHSALKYFQKSEILDLAAPSLAGSKSFPSKMAPVDDHPSTP